MIREGAGIHVYMQPASREMGPCMNEQATEDGLKW
jgi:hypothetical protein